MNTLAPIAVSTYTRVNHLKQTIDALKKNVLACDSNVYIFSDAPRDGDQEAVSEVRKYLRTIDGFKKIEIIERKRNSRVKNNRGGIQQLLDQYGKCIFMEEDIVTAPGFLTFINEALSYYENDSKVLSISGYTPPFKRPINTEFDAFSLQRYCAWGFGIWKDKYELITNIDKTQYEHKIKDKKFTRNMVFSAGEDLFEMLPLEVSGSIDALDVKAMWLQQIDQLYTIYPAKSLVSNIGHDGSGIHCGTTKKFDHPSLWEKTDAFKFNSNVMPDASIQKLNTKFRSLKMTTKIKRKIKNILY